MLTMQSLRPSPEILVNFCKLVNFKFTFSEFAVVVVAVAGV